MTMHDDFDDPHDGFLTQLWQAGTTRVRPHAKRVAAVASIALLVVLVGVLWAGSHHRKAAGVVSADAIPLVQVPSTPWRAKPADPGGMEIPYRDSTVFNALQPPASGKVDNPPDVTAGKNGGDKIENLLAPAAQPVPKAKLFPEQKAVVPEATPPSDETNDADDFVPDETQAENSANRGQSLLKGKVTVPSATVPSVAANGYYVQLGAVASAAAAQASWSRAQKSYAELSDLKLHVEPVTTAHATLYRVQAGPVDQAQAQALCASVKAKKPGGCLVVKH